MSRRFAGAQYISPNNGLIEGFDPFIFLIGLFRGTPTAGVSGYEPGAHAFDITNGLWYRNTGSQTSATWTLQYGANVDLSGLLATAAELNRNNQTSARLISLTGSTTITQATHEGKDLFLNGTGSAFTQTLPAATGTFSRYYFWVGAVNTSNHVITTASGSDKINGFVTLAKTGAAGASQQFAASANVTITLNGTTTGGSGVGGALEFIDIATNSWIVNGTVLGSGTLATPFS